MVYCMQYYVFALRQINPSAESGSTYLFPDLRLFLPGSLEIRWNEWTSGKTSSSQYSGTKRASSNRNIVYRTVPYLFITAGIVLGAWFFMYRTKAGLRLRAIGDHPQAAQTVGINVSLYRYVAVTFCGMLCGLAGGYLSIVQSNLFVKEMVAGREFMALAAMILGGWNPLGALCASLVFAFAQALRISLKVEIPNQLMLMLPYFITLFVLLFLWTKGKRTSGCWKY